MSSVVLILKSSNNNTDLTWNKGGKRQMANIERFLDELSSFDELPFHQVLSYHQLLFKN